LRKKWAEEEIKEISKLIDLHSNVEIAKIYNVSKYAIESLLKKMKRKLYGDKRKLNGKRSNLLTVYLNIGFVLHTRQVRMGTFILN